MSHHIVWEKIGSSDRYNCYYGGELICRSRVPFTDAARVLLARGVAGYFEKLTGGPTASEATLSCTVGTASKLTVSENSRSGPKFVPFREFPQVLKREAAE